MVNITVTQMGDRQMNCCNKYRNKLKKEPFSLKDSLHVYIFYIFNLYVTQNGISSSKLSIGASAAGLLAGVARGAVGALGAWLE